MNWLWYIQDEVLHGNNIESSLLFIYNSERKMENGKEYKLLNMLSSILNLYAAF